MKNVVFLCILFFLFSCEKKSSIPETEKENKERPVQRIEFTVKDSILYNGISIDLTIDATTNFKRIIYYIDNVVIDTVSYPPYSMRYTPKRLQPGKHILKCAFVFPSFTVYHEKVVESRLRVSEKFQGGVIFHLENDELNGLIALESDISSILWGPNIEIGANSLSDGEDNTKKIIDAVKNPTNEYIAFYLLKKEYADWYIPSIEELIKLKANKNIVGKFNESYYFSSSESDDQNALGIAVRSEENKSELIEKNNKAGIRLIKKIRL